MIKSFADAQAEKIFAGTPSRRLPFDIQRAARRKLLQLDSADKLEIMRLPPGHRLEALHGDRRGQFSIRINDQWRICFRWLGQDAFDVTITDYR